MDRLFSLIVIRDLISFSRYIGEDFDCHCLRVEATYGIQPHMIPSVISITLSLSASVEYIRLLETNTKLQSGISCSVQLKSLTKIR